MTTSYTVGEAVAKYPKKLFRRADFEILAGLECIDDFAPGFDLQSHARRLAAGQQSIKKGQNGIYGHEGLLKTDIANYIILGTTQILKEIGESKSPIIIPRLSPMRIDRSHDGERRIATTLSLKEMRLPDYNRLRLVKEEVSEPNSFINEHVTAWYLEVVGAKEFLENQVLLAGYRDVHAG